MDATKSKERAALQPEDILKLERPTHLKTLFYFVFGFSGAGTAAPARLLMPKEIDAGRAFNRTTLLISSALSQHI
jgi:hypothetical protein